jgi:ribosome-associated protein
VTNELQDKIKALATLLRDENGEDVVCLDVGELCGWTDAFVIATVRSTTHAEGLDKLVRDFGHDHDLAPFVRDQKPRQLASEKKNSDWLTLDLGAAVVHLMTEEKRSFYELETLWVQAPRF